MKHIQILIISAFISISSFAQTNGIKFSSAVEYNNYIVDKQTDVANQILGFSSVKELDKKEEIIDATIPKLTQHIKDIQNMPAWKGNVEFRNNSATLFIFYKDIFSTSYKRIIEIQKDGVITDKEKTEIQKITTDINTREAKLDVAFSKAQHNFASQNNMTIQANPLQNKVNQHKKN